MKNSMSCLFILYAIFSFFYINKIQTTNYAESGVNIEIGDNFVKQIAPLAQATRRIGTNATLGGFSSIFDLAKTNYKDPLILSTTDGVGTKLKLAIECNKHDTIGIDLVAMCVNDLIVHGAEPVIFLDYFATGKLRVTQGVEIVKGIAHACMESGCALAGGETAEMPGMYHDNDYDLAGFAIGIVERNDLLPRMQEIKPGDIVIGLASNGLHSNGFSLVRYILQQHAINIFDQPPFASNCTTLAEELLKPTYLYIKPLLPLVKSGTIKALAHITGGGLLENIPRILPEHCAVELDMQQWEVPPIFSWLAQVGKISAEEMLRTFNVGIGMIIIVEAKNIPYIQQQLQQYEQKNYIIGNVITYNKNKKQINIQNTEILYKNS